MKLVTGPSASSAPARRGLRTWGGLRGSVPTAPAPARRGSPRCCPSRRGCKSVPLERLRGERSLWIYTRRCFTSEAPGTLRTKCECQQRGFTSGALRSGGHTLSPHLMFTGHSWPPLTFLSAVLQVEPHSTATFPKYSDQDTTKQGPRAYFPTDTIQTTTASTQSYPATVSLGHGINL